MTAMKKTLILLLMLFITLFTLSQQLNKKEGGPVTERDRLGLQGDVTYVQQFFFNIDTLNKTSVVKHLRTCQIIKFNRSGNVISQKSLAYSLAKPEGKEESSEKIDLEPWLADQTIKFKSESDHNTTVVLNENEGKSAYSYDDNGNLKTYKHSIGNDISVKIDLSWDKFGNWTKLTLSALDDIGTRGNYYYQRTIEYADKEPTINKIPFLTINGLDLLSKEKRNIIDYYVLLKSVGNNGPWLEAGKFDLNNGYFEFSDAGGEGTSYGQLALFRGVNGMDILAYNSYRTSAVLYEQRSGEKPIFYTLQNLNLVNITNQVFPSLGKESFYPMGYKGNMDLIHTYYILPQYGLNIKYTVDTNLGDFCKTYQGKQENMTEACESYSKLVKKEITISFDKSIAKFVISKK